MDSKKKKLEDLHLPKKKNDKKIKKKGLAVEVFL